MDLCKFNTEQTYIKRCLCQISIKQGKRASWAHSCWHKVHNDCHRGRSWAFWRHFACRACTLSILKENALKGSNSPYPTLSFIFR